MCNKRLFIICKIYIKHFIHRKNDFAERFKILAGYRSENNFVEPSK